MSDIVKVALISGAAVIIAALIARTGVRTTQQRVKQIDDAVNHKGKGMPTIAERVIHQDETALDIARQLAVFRDWTSEALVRLAQDRGVDLSPVPPPVITVPLSPGK